MKSKSNTIQNNDKNNYKVIYEKIKEEIKSVVITKLLNQIELLSKKLEKLQKENSLIKNDLIYILKRVLLNKNDYIGVINSSTYNSNNQIRKNIYSINGLNTNNSYFNSKSYNSFLSSGDTYNNYDNINNNRYSNYNRSNTSINRKQIEQRRYSIDDDAKKGNNSSISPLENSLQFNIQNKIDHYLNSLYRHNFAEECASGTASVHLLNKDQSIYDELFTNKIIKNKNLNYMNTDNNFKKVSCSRDKKNSRAKNFSVEEENNNKNNLVNKKYSISNYKMQKTKTNNNILKVHRKSNLNNNKSKSRFNDSNKKKVGSKSSTNITVNSNNKNIKYNSTYSNNRSRFLVNKF